MGQLSKFFGLTYYPDYIWYKYLACNFVYFYIYAYNCI